MRLLIRAGAVSEIDVDEALRILQQAFPNGTHAQEANAAFFNSYSSKIPIMAVTLRDDAGLAAIAFTKAVEINIGSRAMPAISVGPLAVSPRAQGRGVGAFLMKTLDDFASSLGAEAIYLQGIPEFYSKFGYIAMMPKSKVKLQVQSVRRTLNPVSIRPARLEDSRAISTLYSSLATGVSGAARRADADWQWLLGPASNSWYFQNPLVIEAQRGILGYFCADRQKSARIRELGYAVDRKSILDVLSAFQDYARSHGLGELEIMTWHHSPLHLNVMLDCNAEFVQHYSATGGQLIKFLYPIDTVKKTLTLDQNNFGPLLDINFHGCQIRVLTDKFELRVDKRALGGWLFGVFSLNALLTRRSAILLRRSERRIAPRELDIERRGYFVFQGDNL